MNSEAKHHAGAFSPGTRLERLGPALLNGGKGKVIPRLHLEENFTLLCNLKYYTHFKVKENYHKFGKKLGFSYQSHLCSKYQIKYHNAYLCICKKLNVTLLMTLINKAKCTYFHCHKHSSLQNQFGNTIFF
jgi:hypothetical protein